MGQFTLKIDTDNSAFEDVGTEIARILRELSKRINGTLCKGGGDLEVMLKDHNGNKVGDAVYKDD